MTLLPGSIKIRAMMNPRLKLFAESRVCRLLALACLTAGGLSAASAPAATRDCPECPIMVLVPAGRFVMGAAPGEEDREQLAEEFRYRSAPPRTVELASFLAGQFEVTRGQYRAFAQATGRSSSGCFRWTGADFTFDTSKSWDDPGFPQDDSHPAVCVSWEDAAAYARWLSQRTGKRYRLLTEAEWEYAARAGTRTARYWGDDPGSACRYANGADVAAQRQIGAARAWNPSACDDGFAHTAPVGRFRPNAFGLHDMLGNVGEWTQDCWIADYRDAPGDGRPRIAGECAMRAVRGGSWDDASVGLRAAYRVGSPPVIRLYSRGFRVARDP